METRKATILREEGKTSLCLKMKEVDTLEIVLTEDKPNDVKNVFNNLLKELKKEEFNFSLTDDKEDLYYYIATEYISQLNSELSSIYKEIVDYDLQGKEEDIPENDE